MGQERTISFQLENIIKEYTEESKRDISKAQQEVAKEAVRKLKDTSPKRTGEYASGWTVRKNGEHGGIPVLVIHNRTKPSLTHVLENSHVIRNKKGTYGRTSPGHGQHIHIAPVEEWANEEVVKRIKEALSR